MGGYQYLLSSILNYGKLLSSDAGPAVALEYCWIPVDITTLNPDIHNLVIIDNRHHDPSELRQLSEFINKHPSTIFVLRVVDPYFHHSSDPWYIFCRELVGKPNIHFIGPYNLTGILRDWLSSSIINTYIHAPYTYDQKHELPINHSERLHCVALSGAIRKNIYPLRHQAYLLAKFYPIARLAKIKRLIHPGYPEKSGSLLHMTVGKSYLDWLSKFTLGFTDSSIYRIELLKYREMAYAGCAPIGDLPWSLHDCPKSGFIHHDNLSRLLTVARSSSEWTESIACSFREYLRVKRPRATVVKRVNYHLESLLH